MMLKPRVTDCARGAAVVSDKVIDWVQGNDARDMAAWLVDGCIAARFHCCVSLSLILSRLSQCILLAGFCCYHVSYRGGVRVCRLTVPGASSQSSGISYTLTRLAETIDVAASMHSHTQYGMRGCSQAPLTPLPYPATQQHSLTDTTTAAGASVDRVIPHRRA